ncbi:transglutaminase family protein [Marivita sp. XM-24bin2]|uniref:transglutaminase-like domain-containing protein n=1 Tax=unclassified Marivita TaxID=2632480 RepID=UPI000D792850|nr:transglutaminase family protein [Marivita sp. XM-24bin2]MCR9108320.1 transglutaminase family protein [Paracoccaceae bacterium]PWL36277.1 MAG: transglutaminase [Marivita sp. XM-24bin2]
MILKIDVHLNYRVSRPTDLLLQIEAAQLPEQKIRQTQTDFSDVSHFARVAADDDVGERIWLRAEGDFRCDYSATIEIERLSPDLANIPSTPPHLLPGEAVRYLMPSRYCPSDEFQAFVSAEFGHLSGGAQIAAMRDWINAAFSYVPGVSNPQTTALDSFVQRQGICRDYAHVLVTLARAAMIPARFASVYAPGVTPPDFHAVAEVYLDGSWHLVDPTNMGGPDSIVLIGVGADAANVAFLNIFGRAELVTQSVSVRPA